MLSQPFIAAWHLEVAVLLQYFCSVALLLFGWRRAYQLVLFVGGRLRRAKRSAVGSDGSESAGQAPRSRVCVQCPVYNEPDMIESLLDRVARLRWDRDRLEIQVLDDSSDATSARIEKWLRANASLGLNIKHIRRDNRKGFKAGALAYGMRLSDAEFFAIFDADFRPKPDFLETLMPGFRDEKVGAVQARWEFMNRGDSWITLTQSILLDPHFLIEQAVRHDNGLFFTFNGTAGIWRRAAVDSAGGWQSDTMTEDFDLSYRAQLAGWQLRYLSDYGVDSELPPTITAFKAQQTRWTRGSLQVFKKLIAMTCRAPIPLRVKLEAFHHLAIGLIHPVLVLAIATSIPSMLAQQAEARPMLMAFQWTVALFTGGTVFAYYVLGQFVRQQSLRQKLTYAALTPLLLSISLALSLTTALAAIKGLVGGEGSFLRTPKGSLASRLGARWPLATKVNFLVILLAESAFGAVYFKYGLSALKQGEETMWPYFFFLSFGMLTMATTTISELFPIAFARRAPAPAHAKT